MPTANKSSLGTLSESREAEVRAKRGFPAGGERAPKLRAAQNKTSRAERPTTNAREPPRTGDKLSAPRRS